MWRSRRRLSLAIASLLILGLAASCSAWQPGVVIILDETSSNSNLKKTLLCATTRVNEDLAKSWNISSSLLVINDRQNDLETQVFQAAVKLKSSKNIAGVIGPQTSNAFHQLQPFLGGFTTPQLIPLSSDPWMRNKARFPWLLRISDDYSSRVEVVFDTISALGWSNIVGVLSSNENYYRHMTQSLSAAFEKRDLPILIQEAFFETKSGNADVQKSLMEFKKHGKLVIVISCSKDVIKSVLQQAVQLGMAEKGWAWIVWDDVTTDDVSWTTSESDGENAAGKSTFFKSTGLISLRSKPSRGALYRDSSPCGSQEKFEPDLVTLSYLESLYALAYGLQSFSLHNNPVTSEDTTDSTFGNEILRHILFPTDTSGSRLSTPGVMTQQIIFDQDEQMTPSETSFEVVYLNGTSLDVVGLWKPRSAVSAGAPTSDSLTINKDWISSMQGQMDVMEAPPDIKGQIFSVITVLSEPFVEISELNASSAHKASKYTGYAFDLLRELSTELGFSYSVSELQSGVYGYRDPLSGHWSGLIGEVVSGRADMAVGPLTITPQRSLVVDFTSSFFHTDIKYMVNIQAAGGFLSGYDRYAFIQPFAWSLWGAIAISVVVIALYLTLVSRLSPFGAHGHYFQSEEAEAANLRLERRRSSTVPGLVRRRSCVTYSPPHSSTSVLHKKPSSSAANEMPGMRKKRRSNFRDGVTRQSKVSDNLAGELEDSDEETDSRLRAQRQMSLSNALYFAFAGLLWQSPESVPRAPSARIAAAVWYMVGVILVASYTANMVTFVTRKTETLVLKSVNIDGLGGELGRVRQSIKELTLSWNESSYLLDVRQLTTQTAVPVGTVDGSSVSTMLMSSDLWVAEKLYEAVLRNPGKSLQPNQSTALAKVIEGNLAFIWDGGTLDYAAVKSNCYLTAVPLGIADSDYGFALPKDSPFTEIFSSTIKKLSDRGFLKELDKKYFSNRNFCDEEGGQSLTGTIDSYSSLTYASLSGVFDMLILACATSLVFLLLEWIVASFADVDKSDPTRPSEFSRAIANRWRRMAADARENWLPFKKFRRYITRYSHLRRSRRKSSQGRSQSNKPGIEPDQWKRYSSTPQAKKLRRGYSISDSSIALRSTK